MESASAPRDDGYQVQDLSFELRDYDIFQLLMASLRMRDTDPDCTSIPSTATSSTKQYTIKTALPDAVRKISPELEDPVVSETLSVDESGDFNSLVVGKIPFAKLVAQTRFEQKDWGVSVRVSSALDFSPDAPPLMVGLLKTYVVFSTNSHMRRLQEIYQQFAGN